MARCSGLLLTIALASGCGGSPMTVREAHFSRDLATAGPANAGERPWSCTASLDEPGVKLACGPRETTSPLFLDRDPKIDLVVTFRSSDAVETDHLPELRDGGAILERDEKNGNAWTVRYRYQASCVPARGGTVDTQHLYCSLGWKVVSAIAALLPATIDVGDHVELGLVPHDGKGAYRLVLATKIGGADGWTTYVARINEQARPRFLAESCAKGSAEVCTEAALAAKEPAEVRRLHLLACSKGGRDSCVLLAHQAVAKPPNADADRFAIFALACNGGAMFACKHAVSYVSAAGALDDDSLRPLYAGACDAGDDGACAEAGRLVVTKDRERAAHYFAIACSKGVGVACFARGELMERGDGIKKDLKEAARLYGIACDMSHGPACAKVGKQKLACELASTPSCDLLCKSGEFHACRRASDAVQVKFAKTAADAALASLFAKCEDRRKKIAQGDVPKNHAERKAFVKSCEATQDELDAAIDLATPSDLARYKKLTLEKESRCGACPESAEP